MTTAHVVTFELPAGSAQPQRRTLGEIGAEQAQNEAPAFVCSLRVAFVGVPPPEAVSCDVSLPDSRLVLDGLDLPLVLDVELPVRLELIPLAALSSPATVQAAVTERRRDDRWGATRTLTATANVALPVPWWARAATLVERSAVGQWLDAAGVVLASFSPEVPRPRPRLATQLRSNALSPVIFHLST